MSQANDTQSTADLIERTLNSVRAAYEDLSELAEREGSITALVETARGTALLRDLRLEINNLYQMLPMKG